MVRCQRHVVVVLFVQHVLTPEGSRNIDRICAVNYHISGMELMEHAARSAVDIILHHFPDRSTILIACGSGNNGGDGFAMAHMLSDLHDVVVVTDAEPETLTPESRHHFELASKAVRFITFNELNEYPVEDIDIIVDALIGAGGNATLRDPLPARLQQLNEIDAYRIAIDVPTGLDALRGEADDQTFRADLTITMEGPKAGFFRGRGRDLVPRYEVAHIGAPAEVVEGEALAHIIEESDIRRWLPQRLPETNKYSYGRVVVIAGSREMRGAGSLTAEAVLRSGAGLCILATPSVHPLTPREVITHVLPMHDDGSISETAREHLEQQLPRSTVVAVGPGIGTNHRTLSMLAELVNGMDPGVPVIIDADGLRIVPSLKRDMSHIVLTPHQGEFDRLIQQLDLGNVDGPGLAQHLGCVVHLKGSLSVTSDATETFWTVAGNPGMATAGTGDVLTGIIAGFCAQGLSPLRAAALGSFIHGRSGDVAAQRSSQEFITAGDVIRAMADVL